MMRPAFVLMAALFVLAGCESQRQIITQKEDYLLAAGFHQQPANTPNRIAKFRKMPPHRFIRQVNATSHEPAYLYADPSICGCLYVGDAKAYGKYLADQKKRNLTTEEEDGEIIDTSHVGWDWGPAGPGFNSGYGPGMGW